MRPCWLFGSCGQTRRNCSLLLLLLVLFVLCCCQLLLLLFRCLFFYVNLLFLPDFNVVDAKAHKVTKRIRPQCHNNNNDNSNSYSNNWQHTTAADVAVVFIVVVVVTFVEITSAKRASLWELFLKLLRCRSNSICPSNPPSHALPLPLHIAVHLSLLRATVCVVCLVCSLGHFTCCL